MFCRATEKLRGAIGKGGGFELGNSRERAREREREREREIHGERD